MKNTVSLNELNPGESAYVIRMETTGSMRRRFLDMGLVNQTKVKCVGKSPFGDPCAYMVRGCVIAIRKDDCKDIYVSKIEECR